MKEIRKEDGTIKEIIISDKEAYLLFELHSLIHNLNEKIEALFKNRSKK